MHYNKPNNKELMINLKITSNVPLIFFQEKYMIDLINKTSLFGRKILLNMQSLQSAYLR